MKNVKTFDQLLDEKYGKKGNADRDQFDADSLAFRLGVMLKEARIEANLTQEELAEKTGNQFLSVLASQLNPCLSIKEKLERELNQDPPALLIKGNVIADGIDEGGTATCLVGLAGGLVLIGNPAA